MGTCQPNVSNRALQTLEIMQEQQTLFDETFISVMKIKDHSNLFQMSEKFIAKSAFIATAQSAFITTAQSAFIYESQATRIMIDNNCIIRFDKDSIKMNQKILAMILEQKTKQNIFSNYSANQSLSDNSIIAKTKSQNWKQTNSNVKTNCDILKIKQKQASTQYKVLSRISSKQLGQLYKVLDKTTHQIRSLEIIKMQKKTQQILNQIRLLKKLDHPHIYHLYDVFLKKGFYYIIGQYIEGCNLQALVKSYKAIPQDKLVKIIKEVLQTLSYLHFKGIMHRNIKMETVVFQKKINFNNNFKTQFPAIKIINFKKASQSKPIKKQVGNIHFSAPETFISTHNQKCDIWSVGVILYILASGELPFEGPDKDSVKEDIIFKQLTFIGPAWANKSQNLIDLLKKLLHKVPSKRLSAKQALAENWFVLNYQKSQIRLSKSTIRILLESVNDSHLKTIIKTFLIKMTSSIQQRQLMAKKFKSADIDKSGFIERKQLLSLYYQLQKPSPHYDIDKILQKIDVNNSGMIDFSQFMASICKVDVIFARERLTKAFQFIDVDGTGQISVYQLIQLLSNEVEDAHQLYFDSYLILNDFEFDNDQIISKEQFIQFFIRIKNRNNFTNTLPEII